MSTEPYFCGACGHDHRGDSLIGKAHYLHAHAHHDPARYVTAPGLADASAPEPEWDSISGRGDPQQRFRLYRLCECEACGGSGKAGEDRCPLCRGEGRVRELVATSPDPSGLGQAIVELGREGELEDCPIGILDLEGERGKKWIIRPWLPSARNVTDAARTLGSQPKGKGKR